MTKYQQIMGEIRDKILNKEYLPNAQLPYEKELCEKYGVSRITVKKAIDQLVLEGLVVKRRGAGTFVKGFSQEGESISPSFNGVFRPGDRSKIVSEILRFEIIQAPEEVAEKLNITKGDFVYDIIRFRHDDEDWSVIEYTYMPIRLFPDLKKSVLEESIYAYIEEELKLKIQSAHRIIRAIRPNELEKKYLQMTDYDPILEIEQIGYLDSGVPFEYSHSHHKGDYSYGFRVITIR